VITDPPFSGMIGVLTTIMIVVSSPSSTLIELRGGVSYYWHRGEVPRSQGMADRLLVSKMFLYIVLTYDLRRAIWRQRQEPKEPMHEDSHDNFFTCRPGHRKGKKFAPCQEMA
jgi:hypothetical protein